MSDKKAGDFCRNAVTCFRFAAPYFPCFLFCCCCKSFMHKRAGWLFLDFVGFRLCFLICWIVVVVVMAFFLCCF